MISRYSLLIDIDTGIDTGVDSVLSKILVLIFAPNFPSGYLRYCSCKKRIDMRLPTPNMVNYKSFKLKVAATHLGCIPSIIIHGK